MTHNDREEGQVAADWHYFPDMGRHCVYKEVAFNHPLTAEQRKMGTEKVRYCKVCNVFERAKVVDRKNAQKQIERTFRRHLPRGKKEHKQKAFDKEIEVREEDCRLVDGVKLSDAKYYLLHEDTEAYSSPAEALECEGASMASPDAGSNDQQDWGRQLTVHELRSDGNDFEVMSNSDVAEGCVPLPRTTHVEVDSDSSDDELEIRTPAVATSDQLAIEDDELHDLFEDEDRRKDEDRRMRKSLWKALTNDDAEALEREINRWREIRGMSPEELLKHLELAAWKESKGKPPSGLSAGLVVIAATNEAGVPREGSVKCLEFLLNNADCKGKHSPAQIEHALNQAKGRFSTSRPEVIKCLERALGDLPSLTVVAEAHGGGNTKKRKLNATCAF